MLIMYNIIWLVEIMMIMLSVAYITLMERKILGLIQFRLGPNKVFMLGLFQPMGDAVKLFSKSKSYLNMVSLFEYNFMPLGMFMLMLMIWLFMMIGSNVVNYKFMILFMLSIVSINIYPVLLGGWFSMSLYSMMGSLRSVAQMISYEVSFIMIVVSGLYYIEMYSFSFIYMGLLNYMYMYMFMFMLILSLIIEMNRSPADLIEGESELVSGFNTEYSGFNFSLIFLGEYGMILFFSGFYSMYLFCFYSMNLYWVLMTLFYLIFILSIRGILPRIRYDNLMMLCWLSVLNCSLSYLIYSCGLIVFLKMLIY